MKVFKSLPKAGEGEEFYTRYASLIPSVRTSGFLAQVVSGATEFGVAFAIALANFVALVPDHAFSLALLVAVVTVVVLEGGLRKVLPFTVRAHIRKRYKGWDLWITVLVSLVSLVLLLSSGVMSFQGSTHLIEAVAPAPDLLDNTSADSSRAAAFVILDRRFSADTAAVNRTAAAALVPLSISLRKWERKEAKTGRSYSSRINRYREKIQLKTADRDGKLAKVKADHFAAVSALESDHRSRIDKTEGKNDELIDEAKEKVSGYGFGLGLFTIVCLIVLISAVILEELLEVGAGVEEQVEPGAFDFEPGVIAAFLGAVGGRMSRFIYGVIHGIEKGTREPPKPVKAPALWEHGTDGMRVVEAAELVERKKGKFAPTADDKPRTLIGFNRKSDATDTGSAKHALTHCVSDDEKKPVDNRLQGTCEACGTPYFKKTTWQKYCSKSCRQNANAEKHGGVKFDPQFKYRKDGK